MGPNEVTLKNLVVAGLAIHLKKNSQIGSFPQGFGVEIKNIFETATYSSNL